jgi:hypothetical protein
VARKEPNDEKRRCKKTCFHVPLKGLFHDIKNFEGLKNKTVLSTLALIVLESLFCGENQSKEPACFYNK